MEAWLTYLLILFVLAVFIFMPRLYAAIENPLPSKLPFRSLIYAKAKKYNLDPCLVAAIVRQESNFEWTAERVENGLPALEDGADASLGLMQLLVSTVRREFDPDIQRLDLFDPERNLELGTRYLAHLRDHYGIPLPEGIDAYNSGPAAWRRGVRKLPYRNQILRYAKEFCPARYAKIFP